MISVYFSFDICQSHISYDIPTKGIHFSSEYVTTSFPQICVECLRRRITISNSTRFGQSERMRERKRDLIKLGLNSGDSGEISGSFTFHQNSVKPQTNFFLPMRHMTLRTEYNDIVAFSR